MAAKPTVVFIHGLWLHADSWRPWVELFRTEGYDAISPGWPGDSTTVAQTRARADWLANRGLAEVTDQFAAILRAAGDLPIVIGHSVGGLIAQRLLGMGLAAAAVAVSPAQMRGVLPVPLTQLRSLFPVLRNPANYRRAVMLSRDQFRRGFANAIPQQESDALYERYAIPAPARPLFEAALANVNPWTAARVDTLNPRRGPLLIIGGGDDVTVPESIARAVFSQYRRAMTVNEYRVFPNRGHSMVVDSGWRDVAAAVLQWLALHDLQPAPTLVESAGVESLPPP